MTKPVTDILLKAPRKNRVIILEDINFNWSVDELNEMLGMMKRKESLETILQTFDRIEDEIFLALFHLSRHNKKFLRKSDYGEFILILENLDFCWDEPELLELIELWKEELNLKTLATYFGRDEDETFLALFHLARKGQIVQRRAGIMGGYEVAL
jgi:hypothetical protein